MFTLFHHPLLPAFALHPPDRSASTASKCGWSRSAVWERREAFLALNPAGTTPVLFADGMPPIPGAAIIAEYLDEAYGAEMGAKRLMPDTIAASASRCAG